MGQIDFPISLSPAYIARYPLCRKASLEILKYIRDCGANVVHMGNDALAEWW